MLSKRLMMVGGFTGIYEKAKACGFEITVFQDKADVKPGDVELVDQLVTIEKDSPAVVDLAAAFHGAKRHDAVVSFYERGVMNAALIGARLGIHANPLGPVELTRDKGKMRRHMDRAGIPSIPHTVAASVAEVAAFGERHGWPIILKPVSGSGSRQIHRLDAPDQAARAFEAIRLAYPGMDPIAERFIDGPEVSVEAMSWNGKHTIVGITDKLTTGAPHFVETGHDLPSALPAAAQAAIAGLTARFLASIGHTFGPSHTEVILSPAGPVIVESHTRVGGDHIYELVEHVYGIDLFTLTLRGFAGEDPVVAPGAPSGAAIRFITLPEGRVTSIDGLDEAARAPGVVRCELSLAVGQHVKAFTQSSERYGFVLAVGPTLPAAIAHVEAALAKLRIGVSAP